LIHIKNIEDGLPVFKALGSDIRVNIIKLLIENRQMSMHELADALGVTNGALTSHVRLLEEAGIIVVIQERGGHGNKKMCRVQDNQILFDLETVESAQEELIYDTEVKVGHYSDYQIYPTCGLATTESLIGAVDDPRYFAHPDRINAGILWFGKGYVEYIIPNLLPDATKIEKITISFEVSSEAPGVNNDWPSDISFLLNDIPIGTWTSAGDYGDVRGIFTPEWWYENWNQYGLLKMLTIDKNGTFIDGLKISSTNINQFNLDYKSVIKFKFQVFENAKHVGGLTIFGSQFGNYNQDIKVHIAYSQMQ